MTGGVLMSKNNLLLGFILGLMATFFLLSAGKAQDRIPACPPLGKTLKMIKPLREMNWANDTIAVIIRQKTVNFVPCRESRI